ncbi:bacillithiol biosynthesis cysteine-adding enzyme BshC [soil metagenome]
MKADCVQLPYEETGYFSTLVTDYLRGDAGLEAFYAHKPDVDGIKASIKARQQFNQPREMLVNALIEQYKGHDISEQVVANMEALRSPDTFTITTAHQPNILTGPLYFIYKILHAIKLAAELKKLLPQFNFVPVYYMGSEDADLEELGHIFLDGEKLEWTTDQSGAVGRMNTKGIEKLIDRLEGEFGNWKYGAEMVAMCRQAYQHGNNVQQATLWLVNELFKSFGLIVLVPDNASLKKAFNTVVEKELTTRFSYPLVQKTIAAFGSQYKVQAAGRAINLFYLSDDGSRDRIELQEPANKSANDSNASAEFVVVNKGLTFTQQGILDELHAHPERFSGNVILRPVFQETILPNIAFIGGGGELAYWMELKKVFEAAEVPYPVLLLRNSLLLVLPTHHQLQQKLAINTKALFQKQDLLIKDLIQRNTDNKLDTKEAQKTVYDLYKKLQDQASDIDPTLKAHVAALHVRTLQGLTGLEKKFLRAEKRKQSNIIAQVKKLKSALFPNENLQERIDNFMPLYATYGFALIQLLYEHSQPIAKNFSILYLEED